MNHNPFIPILPFTSIYVISPNLEQMWFVNGLPMDTNGLSVVSCGLVICSLVLHYVSMVDLDAAYHLQTNQFIKFQFITFFKNPPRLQLYTVYHIFVIKMRFITLPMGQLCQFIVPYMEYVPAFTSKKNSLVGQCNIHGA